MWPYLFDIMMSRRRMHLPVFEMPHATVTGGRLPDNSQWDDVVDARDPLLFTGTQLTHAIIKADHLNYRNPSVPGLAFVIQSHDIIDWASDLLCLKAGGSGILQDFVRTSMTGRVGQGIAILFAQSQGYKFTAHLEDHLVSSGVSVRSAKGKKRQIADFVFDNGKLGRAIVESKASFESGANDLSDAKSYLKSGLNDQVIPWMSRINPRANKGFVVKSYVREHGSTDDSALVFVDPEGDSDEGMIELSYESVRRSNYAAWLNAMGLRNAAKRLRTKRREETEKVRFLVVKDDGSRLAIPWQHKALFDTLYFEDYYMMARHNRSSSHLSLPFLGMDYNALIAVSETIGGNSTKLMRYGTAGSTFRWRSNDSEYAVVSVFPDGTAFGDLGQVLMHTKQINFEFVDVSL